MIDKYLEIDSRYCGTLPPDQNPLIATCNGGLEIETFFPTDCPRSNLNNHSIVMILSYAGSKILFPGDNEAPSWNELLELDSFRRAIRGTNILVAPHHGRRAGFSEELFDYITPSLVIISDGPSGSTSATELYRQQTTAEGWNVKRRNGDRQNRHCLTTRKDGVIVVQCWTGLNGTNYLEVTVD